MRISRALAMAGIASRRKCETHVLNGAVQVNGEVVRDLGRQVDPDSDLIAFRNRPVAFERFVYYLLNKPKGYTTTVSDPYADKVVFDLLPKNLVPQTAHPGPGRIRVFPVGRLDKDSMGLLLLTNDGDLANRLIHPRYEIGKWYEVRLHRAFDLRDGAQLAKGISLSDGPARALEWRKVSQRIVRVKISEGRKREVRRMFAALGYKVLELVRIAFGPLVLVGLDTGEGRFLKASEILALKKALPEA
ncbi:MAG: pseudouridine synthase [Candidatus Omnitrophota bacterium]|jgi:23S rRNA pseudouridine2605 synthase